MRREGLILLINRIFQGGEGRPGYGRLRRRQGAKGCIPCLCNWPASFKKSTRIDSSSPACDNCPVLNRLCCYFCLSSPGANPNRFQYYSECLGHNVMWTNGCSQMDQSLVVKSLECSQQHCNLERVRNNVRMNSGALWTEPCAKKPLCTRNKGTSVMLPRL